MDPLGENTMPIDANEPRSHGDEAMDTRTRIIDFEKYRELLVSRRKLN